MSIWFDAHPYYLGLLIGLSLGFIVRGWLR